MSVPAVLIRLSTGEIIKHDVLPVADPVNQEVQGLDPDLPGRGAGHHSGQYFRPDVLSIQRG